MRDKPGIDIVHSHHESIDWEGIVRIGEIVAYTLNNPHHNRNYPREDKEEDAKNKE